MSTVPGGAPRSPSQTSLENPMSPEEMDDLFDHGEECAEHGPDCEDEDCITVEQEHTARAIESDVKIGLLTEEEAISAHQLNGTWDPVTDHLDADGRDFQPLQPQEYH